jgi:hypothetical protein
MRALIAPAAIALSLDRLLSAVPHMRRSRNWGRARPEGTTLNLTRPRRGPPSGVREQEREGRAAIFRPAVWIRSDAGNGGNQCRPITSARPTRGHRGGRGSRRRRRKRIVF